MHLDPIGSATRALLLHIPVPNDTAHTYQPHYPERTYSLSDRIYQYSYLPISCIQAQSRYPSNERSKDVLSFNIMSGVKRFLGKVFDSGGSGGRRPRGGGQAPDTQQPGGDHGKQPNNQLQERDSGKGSSKAQQRPASMRSTLRSFSSFRRSVSEETTPGSRQALSQSDTVLSSALAPASGRINIAASSSSLIAPGQESVPPSGELQHPPATPTHPAPETTALGGDDIMPHDHFSPPHQEPAFGGLPGISATAIPPPNPPVIVITTVAPTNPSSQTPDPVSTPANCISDTKNGPSTVPPSVSSYIWQKTLEIVQKSLAKYQLPSLELGSLQSQSAAENIQSLVAELETAHQENKAMQWRYKDRDGNEVFWVERLGNILKSVDKYAKIVDTAIQHHPDITSLVWAGARAVLQVSHCLSGP